MNILLSSIGRRGYIADYFKEALGNEGYVFGTSNTKWTSGFNHCDENFILSDIQSKCYINEIISLCKDKQVSAIMSFYDQDIDVLSRNIELFSQNGIITFLPNYFTNCICFDKFETFRFFSEKGIEVPLTFLDLDAVKKSLQSGEIGFPLIVKPRFGFGSANLFKARDERELEVFFHFGPEMIVQELIEGAEHSFDILYNLEGKVVSVYCKQKRAMRAGETDVAQMKYDEALISFGKKIGDAVYHVGAMDVDFFITKDKRLKLLELNPRFGGGYPISHFSGANFPKKMVGMLKGSSYHFSYERYDDSIIMMKEYGFINRYSNKIDYEYQWE